jgi:hypothetical protein
VSGDVKDGGGRERERRKREKERKKERKKEKKYLICPEKKQPN